MSQASSLAATANAAALEEMNQKIKHSNDELDLVNQWLHEAQGRLLITCAIALCQKLEI